MTHKQFEKQVVLHKKLLKQQHDKDILVRAAALHMLKHGKSLEELRLEIDD